jgi:Fe-S cluster assembly ATP-binding protein
MQPPPLFEIEGLHAAPAQPTPGADGAEILRGISLCVEEGEVHALMGPNGSGKSTLASTLMGSPEYVITGGTIRFKGDDITNWGVADRGRGGIFLAFQYPQEVSGVPVRQFLRQAIGARKGIDDMSILEVRVALMEWMQRLDMDPAFADRYLNEGFSGGEKKRNEVLQMAMLEPDLAILDETDSGLDIDALKVVAKAVNEVRADRPRMGTLVITHYQRLLDVIVPDRVHILVGGHIVDSGGPELAERLEREGFAPWTGATEPDLAGTRS